MLHEQRILFAQDFSESSRQALPLGLDLARRTGAELHVVHADVLHTEPINRGVDGPDHNVDLERRLRRLTEEQAPGTYDLGQMVLRHAVVRDVAPAPGLLNFADEHDVDLIMMGTHGRRGVDRLLLGSVAEEVARLANSPVMTVREQEAERPARAVERILVPIDYSDHSAVVLRMLASWPPTTAPGWI